MEKDFQRFATNSLHVDGCSTFNFRTSWSILPNGKWTPEGETIGSRPRDGAAIILVCVCASTMASGRLVLRRLNRIKEPLYPVVTVHTLPTFTHSITFELTWMPSRA